MKVSMSRDFLVCSGGCEGLLLATLVTGGVLLSTAAFLLTCGGVLLPLPLLLSSDSLLLLTLLQTPPLSKTPLLGVFGVLSAGLFTETLTFSCVSGGVTGVCWGFGALSVVPWGLVVLGELGISFRASCNPRLGDTLVRHLVALMLLGRRGEL